MKKRALLGIGKYMLPVPSFIWRKEVSRKARKQARSSLAFMSEEHHLVRNLVVKELPHAGKPLSPEFISLQLGMPLERVNAILEELEKNLVFLFRNGEGSVLWAYPVTAEKTPHRFSFETGEEGYAA